MTLGLVGAMAMAPMNRVLWLSVRGVQDWPASIVRHTPPPAVAMKIVLELLGEAAMAVIRPETLPLPVRVASSGAGPMRVQELALSGIWGGGGLSGSSP